MRKLKRGKKENIFGSVPWANRYNLASSFKFCRTFGRTILVSSCGLKKVTIIVAFHFMKRGLKTYNPEMHFKIHNSSEVPGMFPTRKIYL